MGYTWPLCDIFFELSMVFCSHVLVFCALYVVQVDCSLVPSAEVSCTSRKGGHGRPGQREEMNATSSSSSAAPSGLPAVKAGGVRPRRMALSGPGWHPKPSKRVETS